MINIYPFNTRALKYAKQKLAELKGEINNSTIIVGDVNNPISIMYTTTKSMIKEEIEDFKNIKK